MKVTVESLIKVLEKERKETFSKLNEINKALRAARKTLPLIKKYKQRCKK